ncbi:MAG: 4Fe-4S binding protein [Oscillospiraceae bacterium]|nr:4Fe-4S binding protein [Oscillospiraceae bacterium]
MPKPKIPLTSEIAKQYALAAGAAVAGIAAASDFTQAPEGFKPSDVLEGCRSVIVLGVPFPPEALSLPAPEYTAMRNEILTRMTAIAKDTAKRIHAGGHAKAVSASGGKTVEGKHWGIISLKHAAELAGLGVITRNYLLTSPEYGNLLWLSAVLTDAELIPDEKIQLNICESCNLCVEICPSGALDNPAEFGRKKCDQFFKIVDKKLEIQCWQCRAVCPHKNGEGE